MKSFVQVAIQIRSKLTNRDDLTEFSVGLAMAPKVLSGTVEILLGDGEWDEIRRTVTWKLPRLPKGESFMVNVRAKLEDGALDEDMVFPVMIRCSSCDQVSSASFHAVEASGHPASVAASIQGQTFRMVHRLK